MFIQDQHRHRGGESGSYHSSLPSMYSTAEFQSLEKLWWIDSEDIFVGPLVGEGAFSKVHGAKLKYQTFQIPVAVKAVKGMIEARKK